MIEKLEGALQLEKAALQKALSPYKRRIKCLNAAISNLKQFNQIADEMNAKPRQVPAKIEEIE